MASKYIDLHCHPTLKPFGRSFYKNEEMGCHVLKHNDRRSIWYTDMPKNLKLDYTLNSLLSVTRFTQSDFKTVYEGNGNLIVVAMGPMELGLVNPKLKYRRFANLLTNFAVGIGTYRIQYLQHHLNNYFEDLILEYQYLMMMNKKSLSLEGQQCTYKLINNMGEYDEEDQHTIHVILSIEGGHSFNTGLQLKGKRKANEIEVLRNIKIIQNEWEFTPFFITLAHHFKNELCGHAKSLNTPIDKLFYQKADTEFPITSFGEKVIHQLLYPESGKRIHIDVKHMNALSRYEYYNIIKRYTHDEIPIIVSHGAVNQIQSYSILERTSRTYRDVEINFFDDELIAIAKSKGIFGIQLDKRRLMRKEDKGIFKNLKLTDKNKRKRSSLFIWNQIEHIAMVLDASGLDPWSIQSIGSDFDGIINPLSGFWTSAQMPDLHYWITYRADLFLKSDRAKHMQTKQHITASEIADKFMFENAKTFLKRFFVKA